MKLWNSRRTQGDKISVKNQKESNLQSLNPFYEGREMVPNNFKRRIISVRPMKCEILKILTLTQMLQRLPIAPAQVKLGNTSENILNEIHQMISVLYQAKEITKTV